MSSNEKLYELINSWFFINITEKSDKNIYTIIKKENKFYIGYGNKVEELLNLKLINNTMIQIENKKKKKYILELITKEKMKSLTNYKMVNILNN